MVVRFIALLMGAVFLCYPFLLLSKINIPVAEYRTGSVRDFLSYIVSIVVAYGSVLLGMGVYWMRHGRSVQRLGLFDLFKAGLRGAFFVSLACVVGFGLHGMISKGSFAEGVGNLWGLVVIFALLFGALVSGGIVFLLFAVRRMPADRSAGGP
jgi:hypothetical protein